MTGIDLDRGRDLYSAIASDLASGLPSTERVPWSSDDLHKLFDAWGFRKQWLWDGYYARLDPDNARGVVTVPPMEMVADDILERCIALVDAFAKRRGITL